MKRGESVRRGHLLADVHASDEESAARGVVAVLAASELGEAPHRTGSSSTSSSSTARIHARAPGGRDDPLAAGAAARGEALVRVEILDPRLTRPIDLFEVAEELEGDSVRSVGRRGKYLVLRLESGIALLVHLRMTGSFGFEPTTHERAVLELDDGTRLAYRDVRRFGTWLVVDDAELEPYLAGKNGPLSARFTAAWLGSRLPCAGLQ